MYIIIFIFIHLITINSYKAKYKAYNYFIRNASSGSLGPSETGSLDRAKAALERRKKGSGATSTSVLGGPLGSALDGEPTVSGRVEGTRVNPDLLIAELLRTTRLDQVDSKEGAYPF